MTESRTKSKEQRTKTKFYSLSTVHYSLFTNRGFALVAALVVMTLLLAIAGAAMTNSSLGFMSISSDRKYQLATWAADYAINEAIKYSVATAMCPPSQVSGTVGSGINQASWTYFAVPAIASQYCFVHGRGFLGSTSVIKTTVVPRTAKFGGMITRGGTINITGGAAAVAGCDTDDTASCGIMPGVITSSSLSGNFGQQPSTTCASNPLGGLVGSPPIVQDAGIGDLFARYFNVTDWNNLKTTIASKYGITMPPAAQTPPSIPPGCKIEPASDKKCCKTTSATKIECYNSTDCTGSPLSGAGYSIDLAASGCSQIEVRSPSFRIQHNVGNIGIFADWVTVNSAITNTRISTAGSVTLNASATNSQILAAQDATITDNMTNSNVFANNITFNLGNNTIAGGCGASSPNPCPDPSKSGGTFFANNDISILGSGNKNFGTDADPLLMLAGNSISMAGSGNSTIRGFVASNGIGLNITGSYEIKGTVVNNSSSSQLYNSGNADIKFNMGILKEIFRQFGSPMQEPTCGGGNIYSTVKNTKMIAY